MAWRFDQGRMAFFQFDELRKLAKFALTHDLKASTGSELVAATGLPFRPISDDYPPWRNYARIFKRAMIVAQINGRAQATTVAHILASDGMTTADEYFSYFAQAFTDPSPSYQGWTNRHTPRFPLLFALKMMLARANLGNPMVAYNEIIGAYQESGFVGDEDQSAFIGLARRTWAASAEDHRQARESIQVISQISYLSATSSHVTVSLDPDDALDVFMGLEAIKGDRQHDRDAEIIRLADLYESSVSGLELEYPKTALDRAVEAGFLEGTRVERTHVALERNAAVRRAFFTTNPVATCAFCERDTRLEYPWTDRVLDIHHVLPLCSGTRSDADGTVLTDLVAICPTCHRAVHRYYAKWLKKSARKDFVDAAEASRIYLEARLLRNKP